MASIDVATESYRFWRSVGCDHMHACCWVANEQGESGFRQGVVGDHGEAFGPAQHHKARIDLIKKGIGIDIKTAAHPDQLKAIHWEATKGSYKQIWPLFIAANTPESAITILVKRYEQSAQQDRDVHRRTALANYWIDKFKDIADADAE